MGLGSYWGEVIDVLREIIPVYDKVNSFISLGKDVEHRNRAIKGRVKKGDKILDAGSGFGNMAKTAAKIVDNDLKIILYDPLVPMLKNTDRLFNEKMVFSLWSYLSMFHFKIKSLMQCYQDIHYGMQSV